MPSPTILLVEDDATDVLLLTRAFQKLHLGDTLKVARDGVEAMDYLAGRGSYADRARYPLPTLILLDIKLPRRSGLEVLAWLRAKPELAGIAVLIFTSSEEKGDMERAKHLGVLAYLVKPVGFANYCESARIISEYWKAVLEGRPMAPRFPDTL